MVQTIQTSVINEGTIEEIFAHQHAPGKYGAKGVTYIDLRGHLHVSFFKIQEGTALVHHAHALASFLRHDVDHLKERKKHIETVMEHLLARHGRLRNAATRNVPEMVAVMSRYMEWDKKRQEAIDLAKQYETLSRDIATLRDRTPFSKIEPDCVEGFELTAERNAEGKLLVTEFVVDSVIVEHQFSHTKNTKTRLSSERMAEMILAVHESISPNVRRYSDRIYLGTLADIPLTDDNKFAETLHAAGLNFRE